MLENKFNSYFQKLGIKVSYNTLNATDELINAYIKDFQEIVDNSENKKSHTVKHGCYSTMFDLEPREKYTGFEKYEKKDKEFRINIGPLIKEDWFQPQLIVSKEKAKMSALTYKEALGRHVSTLNDCLLYLSGGIDSELVALSMIDNNIQFTPVIFKFIDDSNEVQNLFDIKYAISFCEKHQLSYLTRSININELWSKKEFVDFALEVQLLSTQVMTHAEMVKIMHYEFPEKIHVFGGEVRFISDFKLEDGRISNLVLLGAKGNSYAGTYTVSATAYNTATVNMHLCSNGYWYTDGAGDLVPSYNGNWYTGGNSLTHTYQWSMEVTTRNLTQPGGTVAYAEPTANNITTSWVNIGSDDTVSLATATGLDTQMYNAGAVVAGNLRIRRSDIPGTFVSGYIYLQADSTG